MAGEPGVPEPPALRRIFAFSVSISDKINKKILQTPRGVVSSIKCDVKWFSGTCVDETTVEKVEQQRILDEVRAGNRRACTELVRGHYAVIYRFLANLTGDFEFGGGPDAGDVCVGLGQYREI